MDKKIVNTFCDILPDGHDEATCHVSGQKERRILNNMKNAIEKLDNSLVCDQYDTRATTNDTAGPYRFGVLQPIGKPWHLKRVKSFELVGSQMTYKCECLQRNGLQDECPRLQCRGRDRCRTKPFPSCPPFTKVPAPTEHEDTLKDCPRYERPRASVETIPQPEHRAAGPCSMPCTCVLTCPSTGTSKAFAVLPVQDASRNLQMKYGPVFHLRPL